MKLELVKEGVDDGVWIWTVHVSPDRVWKVRIAMNEEDLFTCQLAPPGGVAQRLPGIGHSTHYLALDHALDSIQRQESKN